MARWSGFSFRSDILKQGGPWAQSPAVSVSMLPLFSAPSRLAARVWLHVRDVITILIIMQTIHTSFA